MKRMWVGLAVLALSLGVLALAGVAPAEETPAAEPAKAEKAADPAGKEVFVKNKCQSCHSLEGQGLKKKSVADEEEGATTSATSKKAPDLSAIGVERKSEWIVKYLQKLETIKEKKHIKKFKGTDEELTQLAAWLAEQKDAEAAKKTEAGESKEGAKEEAAPAAKEEAKEGETAK